MLAKPTLRVMLQLNDLTLSISGRTEDLALMPASLGVRSVQREHVLGFGGLQEKKRLGKFGVFIKDLPQSLERSYDMEKAARMRHWSKAEVSVRVAFLPHGFFHT
eukprot:2818682-Amphidinium_carterae.1